MFTFNKFDIDYSHKLDFATSPQDEYYKHMHTFYEIIFFCKGDVNYAVESEVKKLEPGDVVLIQPGKYHFASVNKNHRYERFVLKLPETLIPDYLAKKLNESRNYYSKMSSLNSYFENLEKYFEDPILEDEDKKTLMVAETLKILIHITHADLESHNDSDEIIRKVVSYIEKNISSEITLTSLSQEMNYSKSYLSNVFKNKMHCSLMQYIKSKKCFYAYKLIQYGEKPLDVAYKLGYNEYSTFFRAFKAQFGFSPSEVRNNLEKM